MESNQNSTNIFPPEILKWLHDRTLTNEALGHFDIQWNGSQIVIPVHDADGFFLFNKYRRNPFATDATPKYKYDFGSSVVIFNKECLVTATDDEPIFVVEGELDVIALHCIGIKAITSTGGAGSFQEEWAELLRRFRNLIVCFDNDVAGINGAIYVQSLLPNASILLLPLKGGKDVTEYLQRHSKEEFMMLPAHAFPIPSDVRDTRDKKEVGEKIDELRAADEKLKLMSREFTRNRMVDFHIKLMIEHVAKRYELYSQMKKRLSRKPFDGQTDSISSLKHIPITNYIQFNRAGYAPCIAHNERTPSMFYNDENSKYPNTVKCFSCGFMGDVVDVICTMRGCSVKEAIDFIKNEKN